MTQNTNTNATATTATYMVDGVEIFNSTPHPINFGVGDQVVTVPPCGLINARTQESVIKEENGVTYVATTFVAAPEGAEMISRIKAAHPAAVIVGSIIAAQAFPGEVVAMTPCPGYERVAPADKRMNPHKFTSFGK